MDYLFEFINIITNLDKNIFKIVNMFGVWFYILIFIVIFLETGFFMALILPEESLLFLLGSLCSAGITNIFTMTFLIVFASIIGDSLNYLIGLKVGNRILNSEKDYISSKKYIIKSQEFYNKSGNKAVILSRLIPLVRTFVPFVAGMARMKYSKFIVLDIIGSVPWILVYVGGGYFFGNISIVKDNFSLALIGVVLISILPVLIPHIKKMMIKILKKH
jgi:membrane-associated protein